MLILSNHRLKAAQIDQDEKGLLSLFNELFGSKDTLALYLENAKPVFTFAGVDFYRTRIGFDIVYFSYDDVGLTSAFVFSYSKARNKMFNSQHTVQEYNLWKRYGWQKGSGIALQVFKYVLTNDKALDTALITDIKQTSYGIKLWRKAIETFMSKGYSVYLLFNFKKDPKCAVKCKTAKSAVSLYNDFVVGNSVLFRDRAIAIVKPNKSINAILYDKEHTLVMTEDEARDLGLFDDSLVRELPENEESIMTEYYEEDKDEYDDKNVKMPFLRYRAK